MKGRISLTALTKLFMLFLTVIIAAFANSMMIQVVLVLLIAVIGLFCGRYFYSIVSMSVYAFLIGMSVLSSMGKIGLLDTIMLAWLSLILQLYPCGMLGGIIIKTTKTGEILYALSILNIPKTITVSFAIMMRYIPTIQEDWRFIKDAMKMRGVSPTFSGFIRKPMMTVECLYVPLLLAASKAADELTIASITRGIENPNRRTSWIKNQFGIVDTLVCMSFILLMIASLL